MEMETQLQIPKDVEKIRSVISYLAYKIGGKYLSTRRLMKLYYMVELKSIEKFQKRLSDATFLSWDYGPYSPDVAQVADSVNTDIKIEAGEEYPGKRYAPALEKTWVDLTDDETQLLDEVIGAWKYRKTDQLVKKTKTTPPFIWTEPRQKIAFDKLIECYTKTYGNKELLKSIEESRKEIEQGNTQLLTSEEELKAFVGAL